MSVLALGLALGAVFLARTRGDGVHSGGPLAPREGYSDAVATPVDLKTPYSWGLVYLRNKGNEGARVVALDLGEVPPGVRILGSYAQNPLGRSIGFMPGFRPTNGEPVVGLDIPPHAIYELVVGLSATRQGRHVIPDVRVRYTSGGETYVATFKQSVVLCAPKNRYTECPSPLG